VTTVLGTRALNRALLERQFLLRRVEHKVQDVVRHLVGMQAQAPLPPYFGLASRLATFRPGDLADLLTGREVARIVLMRGTVHLVTADDVPVLRPLTQPALDRGLRANKAYREGLAGLDLAELAAAGREILEREPMTPALLRPLLAQRWPDRDPEALAAGVRILLPLVQLPPRGIWGAGGQPVVTTAESWLGRPFAAELSLPDLLLRYLAAFGPASVADMQTWSGLARLREVVEPLRPRLRVFQDEQGRELFDLPDAPLPDADVPAPPRFIAPFDNILLSHADRRRIMSEDSRALLMSPNGVFPGTLLVGGFLRGTWELTTTAKAATLTVRPYRALSKRDTAAVGREGERLLRFAEPDHDHEICFTRPA
jgi:hypothetical protein